MPKGELCAAVLKDGTPCKSVRTVGDYCAGHSKKLAALADAESVESPSAAEMVEETAHRESSPGPSEQEKNGLAADFGSEELPAAAEPVAAERIKSIRGALGEGLLTDQVAANIQELLLDGLRASKDVYSSCPDCGKRHPVSLPDLNTRVSAARAIMEEIEGRTKQVTETTDQKIEALRQHAGKDLDSCTDEELTLLIADTNGGEWPSAKDAARKLAVELLAKRDADPKRFVADTLTEDEAKLVRLASATWHWGRFPESLFELAEHVLAGAQPSA